MRRRTRARWRTESRQIIGGMITAKTVKYTRTGKPMAFVTLEDLVGTVEVIVFPKDYEKYRSLLDEDEKGLHQRSRQRRG